MPELFFSGPSRGLGSGVLLVAALVLLLSGTGCQKANFEGASFPPVEGPARSSTFLLYLFRPEGKGVPWGDAAFYHRESPAQLGAVPVAFEVSVDGQPFRPAGEKGDFQVRLAPGLHGVKVRWEGHERLRLLRVGENQSHIALWSLEPGGDVFGIRGSYGRTDLTAWPVDELAATLRRFRLFVYSFRMALSTGDERDLDRILSEDFRDPLGGRRDFARAASHQAQRGSPWRLLGDAWLVEEGGEGQALRAHLLLQRDPGRTFPTLELESDSLGPGRLVARTLY